MTIERFRNKLVALSEFAGKLMVLDLGDQTVHITQHPDVVVEHVERALHPPIAATIAAAADADVNDKTGSTSRIP